MCEKERVCLRSEEGTSGTTGWQKIELKGHERGNGWDEACKYSYYLPTAYRYMSTEYHTYILGDAIQKPPADHQLFPLLGISIKTLGRALSP